MRIGRRTALAAAVTAALLAAPAAASADTHLVDPAGSDIGDCTVNPCAHIQYAVNQASANDTVQAAAGVYDSEPSNQVFIDKGLTLQGAGIGQTILDGNSQVSLPRAGTLSVQSPAADAVTVTDLTVREAGTQQASLLTGTRIAIFSRQTGTGTRAQYTYDAIRIDGSASSTGRDYGFVGEGNADVEIADSQFIGNAFYSILFEQHHGPTDVHDNTFNKGGITGNGAYFNMNHGPADLPAQLQRFRDNSVDGGGFGAPVSFIGAPSSLPVAFRTVGRFTGIDVTGNTITGGGTNSATITIANQLASTDGTAAQIDDVDISDNVVTGSSFAGLRIQGYVTNLTATRNDLSGLTRGIQLVPPAIGTHVPGPVEAHFNRLVNDSLGGVIIDAPGSSVDAENNWWGCNEGPGGDPGCSAASGTTLPDYDPWLVLGLGASPTSISPGGDTSTITADLTKNSAGDTVGTAHRDGFSVPFSTDLASVTSPGAVASGNATATLTSGAATGTATVSATVDNETQTTQVQIADSTPPDTQIDTGPAAGSTVTNASQAFTFSSPGEPTATFECSTDGVTYASCASGDSFAFAEGPNTFSVRAIDAANNTDQTPATRSFTVDTTPPETAITSGPAAGITIQNVATSFEFNSPTDAGATFECRLDSADPADYDPCTSPHAYAALSEGPHAFEVRAVDAAGLRDPSPARAVFIVDTTPDAGGVAGTVDSAQNGACANRMRGTKRDDTISGTGKGDRILGLGGGDSLRGGRGFDCLKGGIGDDRLVGGTATDLLQGGAGDDTASSRDGKRDKVNCGAGGGDVVIADQRDIVKNCETIRLRRQIVVR
jgi:hypothetical protein